MNTTKTAIPANNILKEDKTMTINCNVTGNERKRLAQVLGEILSIEPVYMKAPTFAYVLGN